MTRVTAEAAPAVQHRAPRGSADRLTAAPRFEPDVDARFGSDFRLGAGSGSGSAPSAAAIHGSCEEARSLEALAQAAGDDPALARVASAARAIAASADLGSLASERELERLAVLLRRTLLARAHAFSDPHFRSPRRGPQRLLPSGDTVDFVYERGAAPTGLEARIADPASSPVPDGWRADHVVFHSGVSAIAAVLQTLRALWTEGRPLRAGVWGSYFETESLYELAASDAFRWESVADVAAAAAAVGARDGFDALHIEPVRYCPELVAMDIEGFVRAWRGGSAVRTIVLDTTLSSYTWPTARFLRMLRAGRPGVPLTVVELRSGLKLDQQGLELAGVGVVSVYSCYDDALDGDVLDGDALDSNVQSGAAQHGVSSAVRFADSLRTVRRLTGTSPTMDALAALDTPFVLAPEWTRRHASRVFHHNRLLARALDEVVVVAGQGNGAGLFAGVGHPSVSSPDSFLRDAPFVLCRLREDTAENHGLLLNVLTEEIRRRGLNAVWGSSFGFRAHRYEAIVPQNGPRLLRIAMGSRGGPSLPGLIELVRELARYPDFAALRRAYPGIGNALSA